MRDQNEASVEEILDSIKKVIARDNRADAASLHRERTTRGVSAVAQSADGPESAKQDAAAPQESANSDQDEEIFDLSDGDYMADDGVFAADQAAADAAAPLTNADAREAMRENLAALAMLAEPSAPPQIVRSGETSLEGLTRDLLRPMLAEWLDANLPGMVEAMVQAEIARIAGKRD